MNIAPNQYSLNNHILPTPDNFDIPTRNFSNSQSLPQILNNARNNNMPSTLQRDSSPKRWERPRRDSPIRKLDDFESQRKPQHWERNVYRERHSPPRKQEEFKMAEMPFRERDEMRRRVSPRRDDLRKGEFQRHDHLTRDRDNIRRENVPRVWDNMERVSPSRSREELRKREMSPRGRRETPPRKPDIRRNISPFRRSDDTHSIPRR